MCARWDDGYFDGGVSLTISSANTVILGAAKSCTIPSGRKIRIFYYK